MEIFHIYVSHLNSSFFTLGDLLAGVGLIFTVYQLKGPSWETVFSIRRDWFIFLFTMMGVAVFGTFLSIFIKEIAGFLQISSAFILVCIPFLFLALSNERYLFSFSDRRIFHRKILERISRGTGNDYSIATDILMKNFGSITRSVGDVAANAILLLLTDKRLAEYIVTSRADFLVDLIPFLKREMHSAVVRKISSAIFWGGLNNTNSYFYRELEGNERGLLHTCFADLDFQDEMRLFGKFDFSIYEKNEHEKIKLFTTALEKTVTAYFDRPKENQNFEENDRLEFTIEDLINVLRDTLWKEKVGESSLSTNGTKIVHTITSFHDSFSRIIKKYFDVGKISTDEFNLKMTDQIEYSFARPESLTALYVQFSVDLFANLGFHPRKASVYLDGVMMMRRIFDLDPKFRELFNKFIWYQIDKNMRGLYPAILPGYMDVVGFWGTESRKMSDIEKEDYNKLIRFMYSDLKPKILAGAKMTNNVDLVEDVLLGASVSFDRETGKFIYTDSVMNKTVLEEK